MRRPGGPAASQKPDGWAQMYRIQTCMTQRGDSRALAAHQTRILLWSPSVRRRGNGFCLGNKHIRAPCWSTTLVRFSGPSRPLNTVDSCQGGRLRLLPLHPAAAAAPRCVPHLLLQAVVFRQQPSAVARQCVRTGATGPCLASKKLPVQRVQWVMYQTVNQSTNQPMRDRPPVTLRAQGSDQP